MSLEENLQKGHKKKWIWIRPNGKHRNKIDYIKISHPKTSAQTILWSEHFLKFHKFLPSRNLSQETNQSRSYS